jgi:diguanylate cyclase (GGDEF)-like protein
MITELDRRVRMDELTQLGSKAQMIEWLEAATTGSALALLDLDDFRLLNQTLGHDAGDVVLTLVARRIEAACAPMDCRVARISQDEFAVFRTTPDEHPERLADVLESVFAEPFRVGDRVIGVRATCGLSVWAVGKSPLTMIREADSAMYEAKSHVKGGALIFDERFHRRAAQAFEIAEGLRRACNEHELDIHYQPEVNLHTGRVVAVEALARWNHPTLGSIPPMEFVPVAETSGAIFQIGAFVLEGALAQRRRWLDAGLVDDDFSVAVNLSVRQLEDPRLIEQVRWELEATGCPPSKLCLELTETAFMSDPTGACAHLGRLADLGVRLAIDDFGTGYSSLAYLQNLPITDLKIDRGFVDRSSESRGAALVEAIIGIADALELGTIAEGIETPEQLELVTRLGCKTGQGYLFARPAAPALMADMLTSSWAGALT